MNPNVSRIVLPAALFVAGAAVGLGLGWKLYRPGPAKVEPYAPEIRQKDGSLVLERKPQTLDQAKVKLPVIPRGGKVERLVKVTVLPSIPVSSPAIPTHGSGVSSTVEPIPCPPVTVDLALIRMPDNTQRVIASSPDGTVLSGVDIPVVPDRPTQKPLHWAAGGLWNPADRTYGAYLRRAVGPFEIGAQVQQERLPIQVGGGTKLNGFISVGIRW